MQYRTAAAARKSASLHRDVQKPKDRQQQQQQQQGEVPDCRLWLTGMAMSAGRRSGLNCLGRLSSLTSSPDAAEGCQELQLLGAELHPVADASHPACIAAPRYTGEGPLEQSWLPCCCRGPGERRRGAATSAASRKYLLCGFPGANARRIGVGADLPWKPEVVLLAPRRLLGLARLPSLEWHPPCDLSECFSCRRHPLAPPCCEEGLFGALSSSKEKQKREKANTRKCRQKSILAFRVILFLQS